MKAIFRTVLSAILCLSILFCTGCGDFFTDYSQGDSSTQSGGEQVLSPIEKLNLKRRPNQITILIAVEGATSGTLSTLSLLCMDDSGEPKVSVLQIPAATFTRSGGTLAGYYESAYSRSAMDGSNAANAVRSAMNALKSYLQNTLLVQIDYTVHITKNQLAGIVDAVGGVQMDLPQVMSLGGHNVQAGRQQLSGAEAADLMQYTGFSGEFYNGLVMGKLLITAMIGSLKANIEQGILSLCVLDMRANMTTDVPTTGGSDVFIVRRLIETSFSALSFARIAGEYSSGVYVLCRESAAGQISNFVNLYTEAIPADELDGDVDFCDPRDSFMMTIYESNGFTPQVYTGDQIRNGALRME